MNNFVDQQLMGFRELKLHGLQKTGEFSDLILETKDGYKLQVHKNILVAVSGFFSEQLNAVGAQGIKTLKVDIERASLEFILKFIYTGAVEFPNNLSKEVYVGAQLFGLKSLQTYCGEILENDVNEGNCLELFKFSVTNLADSLRDKCVRILCESHENDENLRKNFIEQLTIEEMIVFISKKDHLKSIPSQENLLSYLINWVEQDFELRKGLLIEINQLIKVDSISIKYIQSNLLQNKMLMGDNNFMAEMMSLMLERIDQLSLTSAQNTLTKTVPTLADQNLIEPEDLWVNSIIPGTSDNVSSVENLIDTQVFGSSSKTGKEKELAAPFDAPKPGKQKNRANRLKSNGNFKVSNGNTKAIENKTIHLLCKSDRKLSFAELSSDRKIWNFYKKNIAENSTSLFSAHFFKNKIYISGGLSLCRVQNFSSYDPKKSQITELCSMKKARASHQTASAGGKIYACGGLQEASKSTEYYNFERNEWFMSASLNEGRQDFGLACLDNCLYAFGGEYARNVEMLDVRKKDWNIVTQMPDTHPKICKSLVSDQHIFCLNKEGQGYVFDTRNLKFIENVPKAFSNLEKHNSFDFYQENKDIFGLFYDGDEKILKTFKCNQICTTWELLNSIPNFNYPEKLDSFNIFV